MSAIVAAEHLDLTPEIRDSIERAVSKIETLFRFDPTVRVFLRLEKSRLYHVIFKAHVRGEDVIGQDTGYDLNVAIHHACDQLRRRLIERKNRKSHQRRRLNEAV